MVTADLNMNDKQRAVFERLSAFSFDEGDEQLTFANRLARENDWTAAYSQRAIEEYRRFLFLAVAAGHPVTPSDQVDQVWHLHLTYTRSYWDRLCGEVLGGPLHHGPTKGGRSEARKFQDWYEATRDSYQRFFGVAPPTDIWPDPNVRFGNDQRFQRVNTRRNWVIPKPGRRVQAMLAAAAVLPLAGGAAALVHNKTTIIFFSVAAILFILLFIYSLRRRDDHGRRGGSCGAYSCGGDGGEGLGCSSCGGGGSD